jgi:hypothetical protein
MVDITLPYNFSPREYQLPQYEAMDKGILRVAKCWHRRAGKDLCDWNYMIKRAAAEPGAYWYMFPSLRQGKKALWEGFTKTGIRYLSYIPAPLINKINNHEMVITLMNGSIIRIVDGQPDKNVGAGPKGIVFSEYSLMRPSVWQYIEPMLLENGGWAIFNGTPRGENHFHQLVKMAKNNPRWFHQICTIEDTGIISLEQIEQLREEGRPEELIQQEYYCSFAGSILGAYYSKPMAELSRSGKIKSITYDSNYLVYTAWDIGIGDATAIWFFQEINEEIRLIDYEEHSGWGLPKYAELLTQKPYNYGLHIAPHDIKTRDGWGSSYKPETRLEQAKKLGITFTVVPKYSIEDGINAVRTTLPRCVFNIDNCKDGIEALKQYRCEFDEKQHIFKKSPLHDWTSHGSDAFRYLATGFRGSKKKKVDYYSLYGR